MHSCSSQNEGDIRATNENKIKMEVKISAGVWCLTINPDFGLFIMYNWGLWIIFTSKAQFRNLSGSVIQETQEFEWERTGKGAN